MKLLVAKSHGFCSGVRRALAKAEEALKSGLPCYVYGEIVHNQWVNDRLREKGARIYTLEARPPAVVVIRAHGIEEREMERLRRDGFEIADATCPVVAHSKELIRAARNPVIIGDPCHQEVLTLRSVRPEAPVARGLKELEALDGFPYEAVLQTTYPEGPLKEIKDRCLPLSFLNSVCPASRERREAARQVLGKAEALIVIGDPSSANCNALCRLAEDMGKKAWLVKGKEDIPAEARSCDIIGITSGASTPEELFDEVIEVLESERGRQ